MGKTDKVLVLGYFGYSNNQLDGQTVKTRNIYELLKNNSYNVDFYDTQMFQKNKLSFLTMIRKTIVSRQIIIIPGRNSLKLVFPMIYALSKIFRRELLFIPVGGWLSEAIKNKSIYQRMLKGCKSVMPQTQKEAEALRSLYNMTNVDYFPNFRISTFIPEIKVNKRLKLVFYARIHKKKGLDIVFYIAEKIKNNLSLKGITIDFYGQFNEPDKEYFLNMVNKYDFVQYKGFIQPENVYTTLSNYDILLFPTRYIVNEGFPGSILDSYMSGVPVIASNWIHAYEFVNDRVSGFVCDIENIEQFYEKVIYLNDNRDILLKMKQNAYEESKKYSTESALKIISKHLIINK